MICGVGRRVYILVANGDIDLSLGQPQVLMLYLQRRWAKVQCMEDQLENPCNSGEGLRCAVWIQRRSSLIGSSHQIIASDYIMSNCNT